MDVDGSELQKIRTTEAKLPELIARRIIEYVVSQGITDGSVLPSERRLMETFAVSRATMREALRHLEALGLVQMRRGAGGGPIVRWPQPHDIGNVLSLFLHFSNASLMDVMAARQVIEPAVIVEAVQLISVADLAQLRESVDRMQAELDVADVFLSENERFHRIIAEATRNPVLGAINGMLKYVSDGTMAGISYTRAHREAVAAAHLRIVEALEAGDADASARAMAAHLDEAAKDWRRRYPELVLTPIAWLGKSR
jgi:GntR family transcriptional regulator, transcriptional repressor for pyruvate dehydrogenase complex